MSKKKGEAVAKQSLLLAGTPASAGIVIGPCFLYLENTWVPEPAIIAPSQIKAEIKLFRHSVKKSHRQLRDSHQKVSDQLGPALSEILEMQISLLEDKIFLREVEESIEKKRYDAAYATFSVFRKKKEHFLKMHNEYFRDRAFDVQTIKELIIRNLRSEDASEGIVLDRPAIVIADNLSPTDTVQLHKQKVLGFATNCGGKTSHTAIVARSLGVPAVVGLQNITEKVTTGDTLILDGSRGQVIINPDPETIATYEAERKVFLSFEEKLLKESSREAKTKDGKRIFVHANIEFEHELPNLKEVRADGVGLFRTEGIFLNRQDLPSEDEQTEIYRNIAEAMHPQKVVIRTLDIGGDKIVHSLTPAREANPFLGWRAIRFWLDHKAGFLAQLKAILRANTKGNVQIMLPMVSGLGEIYQVRELLDQAREILKREKKAFNDDIDLGIMIEIPSVVMLADMLAREVDFFSIGTNDLVQYTLAVDRGNEKVAKLYSHFHPAVLRMIKLTLEAGQQANIPVGMCGEMAADPLAIPVLLAMGFDYLSASHPLIPEIKKIIRELSIADCLQLYQEIENIFLTTEIISTVKKFLNSKFPELYPDTETL